jgi:hypothetical protein
MESGNVPWLDDSASDEEEVQPICTIDQVRNFKECTEENHLVIFFVILIFCMFLIHLPFH